MVWERTGGNARTRCAHPCAHGSISAAVRAGMQGQTEPAELTPGATCRRPLPESVYGQQAQREPLLGVRRDLHSPELGETPGSLPLLERLLRCQHEPAHEAISACLWDRRAPPLQPCLAWGPARRAWCAADTSL